MKNKTELFDYLEKSIEDNTKIIFNEKKEKYNLSQIFEIVEKFMIDNKLICYGGTALNNILPKEQQFYNYDYYSPDYDFFSPTAQDHVKELAIIFKKKKFKNILAKSAVHPGTYKLYVNYIQIADVTQIDPELYKKLLPDSIIRKSIYYAPLPFLRMNLFLELSRPRGDISRWEKVMSRLIKLNQAYPFTVRNCEYTLNYTHHKLKNKNYYHFFNTLLKEKLNEKIIFIGEYAIKEYNNYFPQKIKNIIQKQNKLPTFIILCSNIKDIIKVIETNFNNKFKNIKFKAQPIKNVDDVLPKYYNIYVNDIHYLSIFKTEGCQNYNTIVRDKVNLKIGTLDTILYYYFMFYYLDFNKELKNHLYCYCFILFYLQENYKVNNYKLLQRFNLTCIGIQTTIEDMIEFKSKKYQTLKNKKYSKEYKKYFLNYIPRKTKKNNRIKQK